MCFFVEASFSGAVFEILYIFKEYTNLEKMPIQWNFISKTISNVKIDTCGRIKLPWITIE